MQLGARVVLLLALSEGPGFALELVLRVRERTEGRIRLNQGGTFLALRKLEERGWIRGWTRPTGSSGRPRRYYELTPRGIAEAESVRTALKGLTGSVGADGPKVSPSEAREMADRVARCGAWSALAQRVRTTARSAGVA